MKLLDENGKVEHGTIMFDGEDITNYSSKEMEKIGK